jgi:hypothetical protein
MWAPAARHARGAHSPSPMLPRSEHGTLGVRWEGTVQTSRMIAVVIGAATLLGACANSTQMVASWTDPNVAPVPLRRTLAVFMTTDPGMRRMVEDKLAGRLPGGVPSYRLIPDDQASSVDALRSRLSAREFDGIVVMRMVGVTTEVNETIAAYNLYGYWGYWGAAAPITYTDTFYAVESSLYSTDDGRMLWMGRSETVNPKNASKLADYTVNFAVKNLKRAGFAL